MIKTLDRGTQKFIEATQQSPHFVEAQIRSFLQVPALEDWLEDLPQDNPVGDVFHCPLEFYLKDKGLRSRITYERGGGNVNVSVFHYGYSLPHLTYQTGGFWIEFVEKIDNAPISYSRWTPPMLLALIKVVKGNFFQRIYYRRKFRNMVKRVKKHRSSGGRLA